MNRLLLSGFLAILALQPASAEKIDLLEVPWEIALETAAATQNYLYVVFLGDGWSVASKRFRDDVLDTPEFTEFASSRLVYCPVLAKRASSHAKHETAQLQSLVIHFDIKHYPTALIIAPDGREILRHGYREESVEAYLELLKAIMPEGD